MTTTDPPTAFERVLDDLHRSHPQCEIRCGDDCDAPYESLIDLVSDDFGDDA